MKTVEKKLCGYIKKMDGSLLCIGVKEESLLKSISKSPLLQSQFLNIPTLKEKKFSFKNNQKMVSAKKLRKKFKKKKTDYMICHTSDIMSIQKQFWKDSIFLIRKKIYFYGKIKELPDDFIKKYKRYNATIGYEYFDTDYLITIDVCHSYTHVLKDIWYTITDTVVQGYEIVGDLFMH